MMLGMYWSGVALACLLACSILCAQDEGKPCCPSFDYQTVAAHEIKPHRRTIPTAGVTFGSHQLHLTLTVSPAGDVTDAQADGEFDAMKYWPRLKSEVQEWKFTPFEDKGKPVTAFVEEYIDLVPPERFPGNYVTPPEVRADSDISIQLSRSGYSVTVSTKGVVFEGSDYVAVLGRHTAPVDAQEVRELARRFTDSGFYSMDDSYTPAVVGAKVFDAEGCTLSVTIDGKTKRVEDYVGTMVGMPAVITELEEGVDALARTDRWTAAADGLVEALQREEFNFQTFQAQVIMNGAASRGRTQTVRELLDADVPLKLLPAPEQGKPYFFDPFEIAGWLSAGCRHPDILKLLIDRGISRFDQGDKDLALSDATFLGNVEAARELIAYGANPNAHVSRQIAILADFEITMSAPGPGSILIYAAKSGNPEMVREILSYRPDLEVRDDKRRTAIFWAAKSGYGDRNVDRVECVRLLAKAGADINARDDVGGTPLGEAFLSDVREELQKLGAKY